MSDRAYTKIQAQQKASVGMSPRRSLLQRTCAYDQHTIAGGESTVDRASRFGHDFSQIPISSKKTAGPQTKLKVNQPGDAYEQEADQVSEQVMHMAGSESVASDDEDEAKNALMRKQRVVSGPNTITSSPAVPPVVHAVLNSGGQPLGTTARAFMEPRFGHDFSQVRVHTDERAAESARAMNALAYTVGRDVVFGQGRYAPGTSEGRRLLAHELTHTIQQSADGLAIQRQPAVQTQPGDYATVDADHLPKNLHGPTEFLGLLSEGYYRWLEIEPSGGTVETGNPPIGGSSKGKLLGGDVLRVTYQDTSKKRLIILRQYLQIQAPAQEAKNYYVEVWWKIHDAWEFGVISNFAQQAERGQGHATAFLLRPVLGDSGLWQIARQEAMQMALASVVDLGAGIVIRRISRPQGGEARPPRTAGPPTTPQDVKEPEHGSTPPSTPPGKGTPKPEPPKSVWVQHRDGRIREYHPSEVEGDLAHGAEVSTVEGAGKVVSRGEPPHSSQVVHPAEPPEPAPIVKQPTPRELAAQRGRELLKAFKEAGVGTGAGRSGGHGTPHQRAGAALIREANNLPKNDPMREALKIEGERLIEQGKSHSHR